MYRSHTCDECNNYNTTKSHSPTKKIHAQLKIMKWLKQIKIKMKINGCFLPHVPSYFQICVFWDHPASKMHFRYGLVLLTYFHVLAMHFNKSYVYENVTKIRLPVFNAMKWQLNSIQKLNMSKWLNELAFIKEHHKCWYWILRYNIQVYKIYKDMKKHLQLDLHPPPHLTILLPFHPCLQILQQGHQISAGPEKTMIKLL